MKDKSIIKILVLYSIPFILISLNQQGILALLPFVREEFVLTRAQVGLYTTSFYISAASLGVFTGSIVDRLGAHKSMLIGIGWMVITIFLHGFSPSYGFIIAMAFISAIGMSLITPSVNKGVMNKIPLGNRAVSMGILQSGIGIGGFAGASLLPLFGMYLGWRTAIIISAAFTLIIGIILFYKLYKDKQLENYQKDNSGEEKNLSFREALQSLFANKILLKVCILGMVFGVSAGAVISHFAVFLSEDLALSRNIAGIGFGIFQVGGIIGRPAWGWFSDKFLMGDRIKTHTIIGLFIGIMFVVFGLFINSPQLPIILIFIMTFLLGWTAFGWMGVYFVSVGESAGEKNTGIATGLSMIFMRIGLIIGPPIFGFIGDLSGAYQKSWLLFGIASIITSLVFYYLSTRKKVPDNI